jgi:hypothetical protein
LYAVGIAGERVIGDGEKSGKTRGWVLDLASPDRTNLKRKFGYWATIDPLALVLSSQVYVMRTLPDPPPIEVLRKAVQSMQPAERKRALERAQELEAHFKGLASLLREGQ